MDGFLAIGGFTLIIIGLVGMLRPEWLWRLYALEPRWRKDNPEQPDDWQSKAKRHGYLYAALGVIFVLLALVLS